MKAIRACAYLRVSTASKTKRGGSDVYDQDPGVQEQPLRDLIAQPGWALQRIYSDRGSGAKEKRPGLATLMADARRGLFDVVIVYRFDRFARSVKQLIMAQEEFRALGIEFISYQEALDTSTPMGKAMFTIMRKERSVIRERVLAGVEYAKRNGTKSGKPIGRPRAIFSRDEAARMKDQGISLRKIASKLGVGEGTVRRALAAAMTASQPRQNPTA